MTPNDPSSASAFAAGKVSVIIPARNAARWIGDALRSVAAQHHRPLEVFVIDDGSTDDTAAIAARFSDALELRLLQETGRGPSAARNRGLDAATGEFVQFLDADDFLEPWKISRQVAIARETGADVVWGDFERAFDAGEGIAGARRTEVHPTVARDPEAELITEAGFLQVGALLVRRSGALGNVRMPEGMKVIEDLRYQLALIDAGATYLQQPGRSGFVMREHDGPGRASRQSPVEFWAACLDNARDRDTKWRRDCTLTPARARSLASAYTAVARGLAVLRPDVSRSAARRASELDPRFYDALPKWMQLPTRYLGLQRTEVVAEKLRSIRRGVRACW